MSCLKYVCGAIGDWRYASEASDKYIAAFQQINERIPVQDPSIKGVVQIITGYANFDESGINAEINRIFQAEAWAASLSSPKNQRFVTQYSAIATELVLPPNSVQYLTRIAARIDSMPSLMNLIFRFPTSQQNLPHVLNFYRNALQGKPTIRFMSFEAEVSLPELSAATLNQPLETLLVSRCVRNSEANAKVQEGDAKAMHAQESLVTIVTRFRDLRRLKLNAVTDGELLGICSACARIQNLEVGNNFLNRQSVPAAVQQLPELTALDISGMRGLQMADFAILARRPFQKLVLAGCIDASNGTLIGLLRRINTLKVLDISGIRLNYNDFEELGAFRELRVLTMKNCFRESYYQQDHDGRRQVDPIFARSIGSIRSLVQLDTRGCIIVSCDFEYITSFSRNLRKISCGGWTYDAPDVTSDDYVMVSPTVEKPDSAFIEIIEKRKRDRPELEIVFESNFGWETRYHGPKTGSSIGGDYDGPGSELPDIADY